MQEIDKTASASAWGMQQETRVLTYVFPLPSNKTRIMPSFFNIFNLHDHFHILIKLLRENAPPAFFFWNSEGKMVILVLRLNVKPRVWC